jgi:hypothetical protein
MTLIDIWKKIEATGGPTAVMLNQTQFEILPIAMAKNPDLRWDLIYIRNDGWSLGCDFYHAEYAEKLFKSQWVGLVRRGDTRPRPVHFPS